MKKRVVGQVAIGAPVAAVAAWLWNGSFPEFQMPAEVAAAVGGLLGPAISWAVSWLPQSGE